MSRKDRLSSAIDALAEKLENGHLLAASDSAEFLTAAASEIDRLTRELAEAKARAVIPDGWVAVRVEPITGENYANGLWSRRNWTAALEDMLSARPDPKEPSDVE